MDVNGGEHHEHGFQVEPAVLNNGYSIQRVSSLEQWHTMIESWNDLLLESNCNTIFLTWEWLYTWAKCFLGHNRKLFMLYVYHNRNLVGIAPFYVQKAKHGLVNLREIRFLGSPETGSDYLDIIIKKGREKATAEAIYEYLFDLARGDWDELQLTDIPADSLFFLHFMNRVEKQGKYYELNRCAVMPQTKLPADMESFFSMLSANRRERFRRDMRRLHKEGNPEHLTYDGSDYENGLSRFFNLYNTKSGYNGTKLHTFFSGLGSVGDAKQRVQIDILCVRSTDIAGLLHLDYDNKKSMLLMVVDKNFNQKISFGNLLVGMCMQNSVDTGHDTYDFLKGDEDYKFHWANQMRTSLSITLNQRRPQAILLTTVRLIKYALKTILR
ncbi:MAG: GNAT family N-acetyltransferase [Sedimentisphaerales bacterium]